MSKARMHVPSIEIASEEDKEIFRILSTANTIAVVGATNRESMPVYGVMLYLQNQVRVWHGLLFGLAVQFTLCLHNDVGISMHPS